MWRGASSEQQEMLDWVFGAAPSGMAIVEYDQVIGGTIVCANPALEVITGYSKSELEGMLAYKLIPEVSEEAAISRNEFLAGKRSHWSDDVDLRTRTGEIRQIRLTVSSVTRVGDTKVGIAHAEDITERKRASSRLEFLEGHDALTGLPGAQRMEQELQSFSHRIVGRRTPRALVVVDIDGFTYLNDRLGYDGGDQVLRSMATMVERVADGEGLAVRIGANRFAMFWPNLDAGEVVLKTSYLLQEVRGTDFMAGLPADGGAGAVTASAGIAVVEPGDVTAPSKVLATADQALRKAKQAGRDCLVTLDINRAPTGLPGLSELRELILRGVSDEGTFFFEAQPILSMETGEGIGHELLLRAKLSDGSIVMPDEIIPVAEETGLIRRLDRWVACRGIELAARGGVGGAGGSIWMNMSAQSLVDNRLADLIEETLGSSGVDPSRLTFEMTEREGTSDFIGLSRLVTRLREMGCSCALDDFGSGYGGFDHLRDIAFDVIKIDGRFVEDLAHSPVDQAIVNSIVDTAKVAGRSTVAEFVTDDAGFDLLREWGVEYAQGFFVEKPVRVQI